MAFYKKRIVERDTPELVAWRLKINKATAQAKVELEQAYPTITPENFKQADAFRERRFQQLMEQTND